MTHIWFSTLFSLGIIIFQRVLTKFHFLTKFTHLEKFIDLMKVLKYEHQSIFPLWGRVKFNFRDRYGKPNICLLNGRLCGGAHEISGIKAPHFLHGGMVGGGVGWMW